MSERVEEIRRQAVDLVDDFVIFHAPEGVITGRMMADLTDRVSNLLTAALAQAEREREEDIAELNRALAVEVEAVALALAALAQAEREGDEARAERNARARDVMHLEAENERLRAQRNKAYAESDTNHAGMVAAQEDAMKMRERTRALEAALVTLMVAPTNHENADTSREYNSAWEAARDTLGFNPFEHRRQAALTEPTPPQEEPR